MDSEEKRRKRQQYNRNWMKTSRALKRARDETSKISNEKEMIEDAVTHGETSVLPPDQKDLPEPKVAALHSSVQEEKTTEGRCESSDGSTSSRYHWDVIDEHIASESESDYSTDSEAGDVSFSEELALWVNRYQIKHNAVDDLLQILRSTGIDPLLNLPKSARTLLKTPKHIEVKEMSGMQYIYLGIREQIESELCKCTPEILETLNITLFFNVDGIPLFKSTGTSFWPILCAIREPSPVAVFPVALTYGKKPANLDFLVEFVSELKYLLHHGLQFDNKTISVKLGAVVCDAPAKAMVKGIKHFTGYFGCGHCNQKGKWAGRMTYPEVDFIPRTNTSFRGQENAEHHITRSPFCEIPEIDMIGHFPVDYMHQVCLGCMKRLLLIWLRGNKAVKISYRQSEEISQRLLNLQRFIPNIFARKPRSLTEVDRFKATEYRQILLYTGKLVFKGIISDPLYSHFMVLSTAISILVSKTLTEQYLNYAENLLKHFVSQAQELYGEEFLVYNVHSLLHLASDVTNYGNLDTCSAFPFENYMQHLKRMVRSGRNPLVQVYRRMHEAKNICKKQVKMSFISTKAPNNCYVLDELQCCEVTDRTNEKDEGNDLYLCRVFKEAEALYNEPCDSRIVGVFAFCKESTQIKALPANKLKRRAIKIEQKNGGIIFMAILHEYQC